MPQTTSAIANVEMGFMWLLMRVAMMVILSITMAVMLYARWKIVSTALDRPANAFLLLISC